MPDAASDDAQISNLLAGFAVATDIGSVDDYMALFEHSSEDDRLFRLSVTRCSG